MSTPTEPTTLERLQEFKPDQFLVLGKDYICELIHNAAIELEQLQSKPDYPYQEIADMVLRAQDAEKFDGPVAARAIGWAWAFACANLDKGIDTRQVECPAMWDRYLKDFRSTS